MLAHLMLQKGGMCSGFHGAQLPQLSGGVAQSLQSILRSSTRDVLMRCSSSRG
jgi:hypothetical protein